MIYDFSCIHRKLDGYHTQTPVVLVPGLNHSLVASGPMPEFIIKEDFIADSTEEQAHAKLSEITNAFLVLNGPLIQDKYKHAANKTLQRYYNSTRDIAKVI